MRDRREGDGRGSVCLHYNIIHLRTREKAQAVTRVREQTHTRTQSPSPAAHDGADPEHEGHEARRAANLRSRRHATHLQTTGGLEESVVWRTGSHALPSRLEHTVHHNAAGTHARAHACTEKQRLERHLCSRLQAASPSGSLAPRTEKELNSSPDKKDDGKRILRTLC